MRFFVFMLAILSFSANAAPINPVNDIVARGIQCANGKYAPAGAECPPGQSLIIFEETFDDQPDWTTTGKQTVGTLPVGWDAARTDEEWHPSVEVGTQPSMQINGNNPDQVYGGTGKAFIAYSESFNALDDNGFSSDGIITKDITPTNTLYVEFMVRFQDGWATNSDRGQIKMFRTGHWDGPLSGTGERYKFGTSGNNAPLYFYDWSQNDSGIRHFHAFRCDQQSDNYFCVTPVIANPPRQIIAGDMTMDYAANVAALTPQIPDLVNGGFLDYVSTHWHNQVMGGQWHKLSFYYQLNSAPGVQDGIFKHWIDGELIVNMTQVPWVGTGGDINTKFNHISLGGNDRYHFDLVGDPVDRERWYAIDNVLVMSEPPAGFE